jgi:hypothetical protein
MVTLTSNGVHTGQKKVLNADAQVMSDADGPFGGQGLELPAQVPAEDRMCLPASDFGELALGDALDDHDPG